MSGFDRTALARVLADGIAELELDLSAVQQE